MAWKEWLDLAWVPVLVVYLWLAVMQFKINRTQQDTNAKQTSTNLKQADTHRLQKETEWLWRDTWAKIEAREKGEAT